MTAQEIEAKYYWLFMQLDLDWYQYINLMKLKQLEIDKLNNSL